MKKIFSLILICSFLQAEKQEITLEHEVISMVDGSSIGINADVIEIIRGFQRQIMDRLVGKKITEGRQGLYEYQGKFYSIAELKKIEQTLDVENEALNNTLDYIKKDFIQLSNGFKDIVQGAKSMMTELIDESCTKRGRKDSILLLWSKYPDDQEERIFDDKVHTIADFELFTRDLLNFLGDLVRSCPKARKQLDQRVQKFMEIKKIMAGIISASDEASFLKYIKINHLDKLSSGQISQGKVKELYRKFKQG